MATTVDHNLKQYCVEVARRAKVASQALATLTGDIKNEWLRRSAEKLRQQTRSLLEANAIDLEAAPGYGLTEAQADRLKLTPDGIADIAAGMEQVAMLPDPIGEIIDSSARPNGLSVQKVRVPLGVIFFIYESRPNVTADAAALCVKSGNAVILRGGKEAAHSSRAIIDVLNEVGSEVGLPVDAVQLVSTTDRNAVGHLLVLNEYISLAIPRGGEGLIRRVAEEARMPVIKHFSGNCHVYIDQTADPEMAVNISVNSKCQRMGVCNAAESLLVHADVAEQLLPRVAMALIDRGVQLRGDAKVLELVPAAVAASEEDFRAEFLGPVMSVRVVHSLEDAIECINRDGSGHTDAIVTSDLAAALAD